MASSQGTHSAPTDLLVDNRLMERKAALICSYWIRTNAYRFGDESKTFDYIESTTSHYYPGVISKGMVNQIVYNVSRFSKREVIGIRYLTDNDDRLFCQEKHATWNKPLREADKVFAVRSHEKETKEQYLTIFAVTNDHFKNVKTFY